MKTEVYSWRLSRHLKTELEEAARAERKSLAELLEEIAESWLARSGGRGERDEEQERVRAAAMTFVGSIRGGNPERAANARSEIKSRLRRRHAR